MEKTSILNVNQKVSTKFLSVVFGYMFLGLLITAATAFGFAFSVRYNPAFMVESGGVVEITDQGAALILGVGIFSIIAAWIDSLVISVSSARTGRAPWIGFILYAIFLGLGLSLVLFAGVDFYTIGEAFGLTALCFGVMFLIGYFTKINLSPLAFVALALLVGLAFVGIYFMIDYFILVASGAWNAAAQSIFLYDLITSVVFIVVAMLVTGWDANRMQRMVSRGIANQNLALFCAFNLYCDFITLFINLLRILILSKNRN